ncbi:MAG: hypothetical protein JWO37_3569 [Acidimicrobiales bacterium]|nr:hypothetical protein [Acidimicrobiales bacterium]
MVLWLVLVGFAGLTTVLVATHGAGTRATAPPRRLPALAIGTESSWAGAAMGTPAAGAAMGASYPGRTEYRLAGPLPELATTAHAMLLKDVHAAARVPSIAKALGVAPAKVLVEPVPGQPWRYGDGMSGSVSSGCAVALPASSTCIPPQRPAGLPSQAEAERIGRDALAGTGVELAGAIVRVDDGFSAWNVAVSPKVDGRIVVGWTWTASVGVNGAIDSASGFLAQPVRGDEYPLIGAQAAFDQLKDLPQIEVAIACAPDPACPTPKPVVRTVTGGQLALMYAPWADGKGAMLIPAYLFAVDDGSTIPVVALPARFLTPPDRGPVETKPGQPTQPESVPPAPPASAAGGAPAVR